MTLERSHVGVVLSVMLSALFLFGCKSRQDRLLESFTEYYLATGIDPQSMDTAARAFYRLPLDTNVLQERRTTLIQVTHCDMTTCQTTTSTIYEDSALRPEYEAMITALPRAWRVGMFIPKDPESPVVELRMNYMFTTTGFVAVHTLADRPDARPLHAGSRNEAERNVEPQRGAEPSSAGAPEGRSR